MKASRHSNNVASLRRIFQRAVSYDVSFQTPPRPRPVVDDERGAVVFVTSRRSFRNRTSHSVRRRKQGGVASSLACKEDPRLRYGAIGFVMFLLPTDTSREEPRARYFRTQEISRTDQICSTVLYGVAFGESTPRHDQKPGDRGQDQTPV